MKFGGNKYGTQFISTGKIKYQELTHGMYQISVDVIFTQIIAKKVINMNGEQ